jgi:hypothetical protein
MNSVEVLNARREDADYIRTQIKEKVFCFFIVLCVLIEESNLINGFVFGCRFRTILHHCC